MEIVSPLLLMTLLVWGYSRSVEEHYHAEMFVNQSLPLSFLLKQELLSNSESVLQLCPPSLLAQQVTPCLQFANFWASDSYSVQHFIILHEWDSITRCIMNFKFLEFIEHHQVIESTVTLQNISSFLMSFIQWLHAL